MPRDKKENMTPGKALAWNRITVTSTQPLLAKPSHKTKAKRRE